MKIPLVDLKEQYLQLKEEIHQAIDEVFKSCQFIKGPKVRTFEEEFASLQQVDYCISVANGTDAISLTLKALGVGCGDEVIVSANTWISSAEAVNQVGGKPVFVDIEADYYNMDVDDVARKITPQTKAILAVHLYGQPANIEQLRSLCDEHSLFLLEDCAQAHLAEFKGKKLGIFGHAATYSFFPSKNIGAYGDAGAVTTNDLGLAEKVRRLANHGALNKHDHLFPGTNSRMDALQAALLGVKLKYAEGWKSQRRYLAGIYNELLAGCDYIVTPAVRPGGTHVYHLYAVRVKKRAALQQYLTTKGVGTGIHYPRPLPFVEAYASYGHTRDDFPIASQYQHEILSLPIYPELKKEAVEYVCEAIHSFFAATPALVH
ncbi:DegT/DnrJ/EryC1/StrS family aminotransferase [Simkania negevensis]|uniref:DegT/DnrJ/EryC1/StrS family aminotransferase n=1 Tax=Simkania negevensis TaxID=83561 RepID=A0ABS3AQ29_9BACT|nr:DegT/DnrJ/EryC1/StrS family aminotransferase [Simkania negevensis]